MLGHLSGYVARITRRDHITVLTLIGQHSGGEPPLINLVRCTGAAQQQTRDLKEGMCVHVHARYVYRTWQADGATRSEMVAEAITISPLADEQCVIVDTGAYLALGHAVCSFDLRAFLIRVEESHGRVTARVWTKDELGARHYYTVRFPVASHAACVRSAQPGMVLLLTVRPTKIQFGQGWTEDVRVTAVHVAHSRVTPTSAPSPAAPELAAPSPAAPVHPTASTVTPPPAPPRPVVGPRSQPRRGTGRPRTIRPGLSAEELDLLT